MLLLSLCILPLYVDCWCNQLLMHMKYSSIG
jgi:hypothetical protein